MPDGLPGLSVGRDVEGGPDDVGVNRLSAGVSVATIGTGAICASVGRGMGVKVG